MRSSIDITDCHDFACRIEPTHRYNAVRTNLNPVLVLSLNWFGLYVRREEAEYSYCYVILIYALLTNALLRQYICSIKPLYGIY